MPLDYENLTAVGAMVGSGGLVVMNQRNLHGADRQVTSCSSRRTSPAASASPAAKAQSQMLALLDDILEGRADCGDDSIPLLEELAKTVSIRLAYAAWARPRPTRYYPHSNISATSTTRMCMKSAVPTGRCNGAYEGLFHQPGTLCKSCGSMRQKKCPVGRHYGSQRTSRTSMDVSKCIKCSACV